ncbi:MAG: FGGY-family carbohydrate kinase, partial [Roseibacillus sp.]|nr:FGGY-family carbohydrate kinase [Roseibacillus sp.]
NRFAMQNKADMAGLPLEVPPLEEATPLGAALLAGIGVGLYKNEQEAFDQVSRPGEVYEPDLKMNERYRDGYPVFEQLYPALKDLNSQITQTTEKP